MARRRSSPAARTVAEILRAQYRPLDYAQGRAVVEQRAEQARLASTTKAVVAALQAGVGPVKATYDNALQQQQALAQNAANLLSGANPNAATQSDLAAVNAPAEQRAQLAGQAQAQFPGQAGVLYTQQGSIPGASLLATRQADIAHLAGMPTLAALQSGESLRGLLATAARQRDKYTTDRLAIAGQAPQLQLGLQQRAEDVSFRQQQRLDDIRQAELNRIFQAEQARLGRQLTPYEKAQIEHQKRADEAARTGVGATPEIIGSSGSGYMLVNPITGEVIKQISGPSKTGTGGTTGMTPTQVRAARAKSNQLLAHVREARSGYLAKTTDKSGNVLYPAPPTYNQAVQLALQQNIPLQIAVPMLNRVFPVQYKVTARGLVQIGGGGRKRRGRRSGGPRGPVGTPGAGPVGPVNG